MRDIRHGKSRNHHQNAGGEISDHHNNPPHNQFTQDHPADTTSKNAMKPKTAGNSGQSSIGVSP